MKTSTFASLIVVLITASATYAQNAPNMPARNPWLADSVYPISHNNSAATDSVAHAGPTRGRKLSPSDVKTVPAVFTSNPTVKKISDDTILFAAGLDGIRKINATGKSFELVAFLPYPGFEALAARSKPEMFQAALDVANAARRAKDDAKILTLSQSLDELGFNRQTWPTAFTI